MFKRSFLLTAACALSVMTVGAQTRLDYPKPQTVDQVDDYSGIKVRDPYRWMEDTKSPETQAWIEQENKLTNSYLATIPQREKIKQRLTELWIYERYSSHS